MVYIKGLFESIVRQLKKHCKDTVISHSNKNCLGNKLFSKLKEPVQFKDRRHVVYRVECYDCDNVYV